MNSSDVIEMMDAKHALFGLLFAFQNRLQATGDTFYEGITSKQFFLLVSLDLFATQPPTAQELADAMGCSHQNVKQILNKLEQKGMVQILVDENDRRKLRISATEYARQFAAPYHEQEVLFMDRLYDGISESQALETFKTLAKMEQNLKKIRGE